MSTTSIGSLFSLDVLDPTLALKKESALTTGEWDNGRTKAEKIVVDGIVSDKRAEVVSSSKPAKERTEPSKWWTPEFVFYGFMFITIIPLMVRAAHSVSVGRDSEICYCSLVRVSPEFCPI